MIRRNVREVHRGFTLIEILIVIGIIAILAAIVIVAINPARQFAQARNSQRTSNINAILNAIGQNIADNKGIFTCTGVTLGTTTSISSDDDADIHDCIIPTYMPALPVDPGNADVFGASQPEFVSSNDYDTGYTIGQNANGRITVCAPGGEEVAIADSEEICVTR